LREKFTAKLALIAAALLFVFASFPDATAQQWNQLTPAGGPPVARTNTTSVFDAATNQMIVFGGAGSQSLLQDTWSLNIAGTPQWTQLSPLGSPPQARQGAKAAYESVNSRMIVFGGGFGHTSPCANDTWVLSNANSVAGPPAWTQLSPSGGPPPARIFHTAVYDPVSNRLIVFGGTDCFFQNPSDYLNDVWVLTNANGLGGAPAWIQLAPAGSLPSGRGYLGATYDPSTNRMTIFGGQGFGGPFNNEVWVLSNANGLGGTPAWTQVTPSGTPPSPRAAFATTGDPASNRMIVFDGGNASADLNETWVLSGANGLGSPAWTLLNPSGTMPIAREGSVAVYVPSQNEAVIFGGQSPLFSDAWVLKPIASPQANFGSVNIGSTSSASVAIILTVNTAGVLGSTAVLTQGAAGLDFTNAGSGTCVAGNFYSVGDTCIVNVNFAPKFAGPRLGGVELLDQSGNLMANGYVQGTGVGPQITFNPGAVSTLSSGFNDPGLAAVDGNGNIFVAETGSNTVKEIVAAGGYTTVNTLPGNYNGPFGVAVDGSGNVFVADGHNGAVKEILAAGGYSVVRTIGSEFWQPTGITVDGSGNVFIADYPANAVYELVASSGYTTVNTLGSGFSFPLGIAVDGSGNVFVSDVQSLTVKEITAASGYTTVNTLTSGFTENYGLGIDGGGNLYVADRGDGSVKEIVAAGGYTTVTRLVSGFNVNNGVAVDANGNLIIVDTANSAIKKVDFADPPSVAFPTPTTSGTSDSTDGPTSVTVSNIGNAPLTAVGPGLSSPADFSLVAGGGSPADCTANFSLSSGASCNLSIEFTPHGAGPFNESVTLTDNALNAVAATQSIAVSGTGLPSIPHLIVFAPNVTKILGAANPALNNVTYSGFNPGDGPGSLGGTLTCTTTATTTSPVGSYPITCSGLTSPNYVISYSPGTLKVVYAAAGGTCDGDVGHTILQPINAGGTSVWKQGRTVPAQFRVCDSRGVSIGRPGVVASFNLIQIVSGTVTDVDETVASTNTDTAFRWDSTGQEWIFNISTKNLDANFTYVYSIVLNDGSTIGFQFGLR
jgi:hypothetical protein